MEKKYNLFNLGWNKNLQQEFSEFTDSFDVGRVSIEYKGMYKVYHEKGEVLASVSGKMSYNAGGREDYPAVGDWVIIDKVTPNTDKTIIHSILKRKSKFSRKSAGNTFDEQIVAANIDIVFLCMALNQNFNLRRLERYTSVAWDSGALPVIILTKSDLCTDIESKLSEVQSSCPGVDVVCSSSLNKSGFEDINKYIKGGTTIALMGSSGVGKSTIVNELLNEDRMITQTISVSNDKGRHTTTHRELIILPNGGIVIDTPGMRELQLLDLGESINTAFDDIEKLSEECRFSDCTHTSEPTCAIRTAIENGTLSEERYNNYIKLKKESDFAKRKTDKRAELAYKKRMKNLGKLSKSFSKH